MASMKWRPGKPIERAVRCAGCGGTRAVAECTVSGPPGDAVFACCPECEGRVERYGPDGSPECQRQEEREYAEYRRKYPI